MYFSPSALDTYGIHECIFRLSCCSHPMLLRISNFKANLNIHTGPDNDIGTFLSKEESLLCPYEQLVHA